MDLKIFTEKTRELLKNNPQYSEEIEQLYYLALSEIEDGSSEIHECNLAYIDMLDIINNITND